MIAATDMTSVHGVYFTARNNFWARIKKVDSFQHFAQPHILHDGKQNYTIFFVPHK